jgi:hypothetical protein
MNGIDALAGLFIGIFLVAVASKGKSRDMVKLAEQDKSFLKFAIAIAILVWLLSVQTIHPMIALLIFGALLGLFYNKGDTITTNVKALWAKL